MKKVIDILSIILPALIILLGIIRVFLQKTKGINGLTMIIAILILIAGLIRFYVLPGNRNSVSTQQKAVPITVSKHSDAFNRSIQLVLEKYDALTSAFTIADTATIHLSASNLQRALKQFNIEELKIDSLIYQTALQPYHNAETETQFIIDQQSLAEKKLSFNRLSNELFILLSASRYDLSRLYWMECSNAFGDTGIPGNWISPTESSKNPYVHNKDCAEIKTSINFIATDTLNK